MIKNKSIGASTGSRLKKGNYNASKGGMPFYKLLGNIILTKIFNILLKLIAVVALVIAPLLVG